jgi:hypothetical protein
LYRSRFITSRYCRLRRCITVRRRLRGIVTVRHLRRGITAVRHRAAAENVKV